MPWKEYVKQYEHGIFKYFSLFTWQRCCECKKEFRRERGFRFLIGPFTQSGGYWTYLCSLCCGSKEAANKYAVDGKYLPAGSSPPPTGMNPRIDDYV